MFEIFTNSILYPKNIIQYHNKKGGFVFLYILILIILMSIATFVFYISVKPEVVSSEVSGCQVVESVLVCDGTNYDLNQNYEIYDFNLYLLDETSEITDITDLETFSMVLKGSNLTVIVGDRQIREISFLTTYGINTIEDAASVLTTSIIIAGVVLGILSNLVIIMFIILISTIPFLRFKKMISYKKIFKMVVFASTPMAFLLTIYNLLNFNDLIFFVLMFFAYRSIFALQRELYVRTIIKAEYQNQGQEPDESNSSSNEEPFDDEDQTDKE